jgi:hypothetical protein
VDAILARGLTVRQTEQLVERLRAEEIAGGASQPARAGQAWRGVFRDVRILSNTFRAAVGRLEQAGVPAVMEQVERPDGLEIRVHISLPAGWQQTGSVDQPRSARKMSRGAARTGRPERSQE